MNPEKCKRQRRGLGLSQQVLAEKIGFYQMAISRYENRGDGDRNLIRNLENFFGDSSQEEQFESDVDIKFHHPTKEEVGKFQGGDEVIRLEDEVSVGTLIMIKGNYLLVSKDLMSTPQSYHPAYFKAKKSK